MKIILEIVCGNLESAIAAQQGGADRIELCDNLPEGGTTPSYGMIESVKRKLRIPVFVMIRPRGGDFLYSTDEFEVMKRDIGICKLLKADGVVFGILNDDGTTDIKRTKELVDFSGPLPVTFHRAFDTTVELFKALEDVIDCGCKRILTSGSQPNVVEGLETISKLIEKSEGRIIIMPGGGIRPGNISKVIEKTNAIEVHSSASAYRESNMKYKRKDVKMGNGSIDEQRISVTDIQLVTEMKSAISAL